MAELNRVARRVALSASLALVAAFAIAAPLKPAVADDDWRHNGQWHGGGHEHGDRDWRHGWYGGYGGYGGGGYYRAPTYYYAPPPVYYYPPPPIYYPPAPVYGPPGVSLDFVIPLRFR
jgi:hypothetical protein